MAVEKKAVAWSVRASRSRTRLETIPMRNTPAAAARSAGAFAATSRATAGVKYRPRATPMINWPAWRPPGGASRLAPPNCRIAMATSGPIIHGSGVASQAHRAPPATHTTRAPAMAASRRRSMARILPVAPEGRFAGTRPGLTCVKGRMGRKANLPVQEKRPPRAPPQPTMNPYVVFLLYMAAILGVVALMLLLNKTLGPKPQDTETKLEPFECGATPVDTHNVKAVPIKYYAVAIIFILFDLETVFLFIWALGAKPLTGFMLFTLGIFVALLVLILLYVYKARLLEAVRE